MSGKFQSILLGALLTGVLSAAYFVISFSGASQIMGIVACCVVPTVGALVAVWHYTTTNSLTIPAGEGAVIGLSASLLGSAVISNVLVFALSLIDIVPHPFDVEAIVANAERQMIEQGQEQEVIDQSVEFTRNFFWAFVGVFTGVYALFGAIVGAIGANVFKKGPAGEAA